MTLDSVVVKTIMREYGNGQFSDELVSAWNPGSDLRSDANASSRIMKSIKVILPMGSHFIETVLDLPEFRVFNFERGDSVPYLHPQRRERARRLRDLPILDHLVV